ncbi:MAG: hypothetical protein HXY46_08075 [Syntrophaceae bacterium]|nr:hypothetical protein [Syntrophaceae bacterium]
MKKLIACGLFFFLVGALSSTAHSQKLDFKASGFIDTHSFLYQNIPSAADPIYGGVCNDFLPGGGAFDRSASYMNTRARLKFDAIMAKELSGTIFFEMDSTRWGETGDGRNRMGVWSGDRAALEIKNVYIDFGIPHIGIPVPITARVGLQPLGVRPDFAISTDGMGITLGAKIEPVNASLQWAKAIEGKDASSDDVDVYGLHLYARLDKITIGGYSFYYNMNTYPLNAVTTTYGSSPTHQADMWWWGTYAVGKAGPMDINFDFLYDRGEVKKKAGAPAPDVKYRGWASRLKVNYPWENFNFGAVVLYASGADQRKTSSTGLPGTTTPFGTVTSKVNSIVLPPGSEAGVIFYDGLGVFYGHALTSREPSFIFTDYNRVHRRPIGGTWMAKVYGSYKVSPWYNITLAAAYIGDTTEHGNTRGTARKAPFGASNLRDDSTIGVEVGVTNEFNIYKNLYLSVILGYLFPGDALEYFDAARRRNVKPDDPWSLATAMVYRF